MGITGSNSTRRSRWLKLSFRLAIFLTVGLTIAVFIKYRFSTKEIDKPTPPQETGATLSIRHFEHIAAKEGQTEWRLTADSAQMFSERQEAVLRDLEVTFYSRDDKAVHLRANQGTFDIATKQITAGGSVIARHPRFKLETESLNYQPDSHIIQISSPVEIVGESVRIHADRAEYELDSGLMVLEGHVESWINETVDE